MRFSVDPHAFAVADGVERKVLVVQMIECTTCRVTFHKLRPQEIESKSREGERWFFCPFCKEAFQASEPFEEDEQIHLND